MTLAYMMSAMIDFEALQKEMAREQRLLTKHLQKYNELHKLFLENCRHAKTENKLNFTEGVGGNPGYYSYWTECLVCGAKSPVAERIDGMQ